MTKHGLLLLALALFMLTSCQFPAPGTQEFVNLPSSESQISEACKAWALSLIPDTVRVTPALVPTLSDYEFFSEDFSDERLLRWGDRTGENVNKLYFQKAIAGPDNMFTYSERVTSSEGVILGTNSYSASAVLTPYGEPYEMLTYSPFGDVRPRMVQNATVGDVAFRDCKKID